MMAWLQEDLKQVAILITQVQTWIGSHSLKRILSWAATLVLAFLLLVVWLQHAVMESTSHRLIENPEPFPAYILSVSPTGETINSGSLCVRIDLGVLLPATNTPEEMAQLALERLALHHNGQLVEDGSETVYVSVPSAGNTIVDYCGKVVLTSGLHLAEVTVQSAISGTLHYQWAFSVQ